MINQTSQSDNKAVTQAIEIAIRLGVVFLITAWCLQILTPFISLIVWGAIIAVAINGPFLMLVKKLGGRKKNGGHIDQPGQHCNHSHTDYFTFRFSDRKCHHTGHANRCRYAQNTHAGRQSSIITDHR